MKTKLYVIVGVLLLSVTMILGALTKDDTPNTGKTKKIDHFRRCLNSNKSS